MSIFVEPEIILSLLFPLLNIIWKLFPNANFISCCHTLILKHILFYALLFITSLEAETSIYLLTKMHFFLMIKYILFYDARITDICWALSNLARSKEESDSYLHNKNSQGYNS